MKRFTQILISAFLFAQAVSLCAQDYSVKLEKAEAVVLCEASDELIIILDEKRQTDPNRQDGDGNYWRFGGDRPTTRQIGLVCLKNKPANSSFVIRLEEEETVPNRHIGSMKATVVQKDGKVQLAFEDKGGLVADQSGRHEDEEKEVYWVAVLKRPDGKPGTYKLFFKITAKVDQ
jgi:hypothetical protein